MKQYIIILFALLAFTACEEITNSAKSSKPTFFPLMTVAGGSEQILACDATSYADGGCTAIEGGEEIDVTTELVGTYFSGSPDINDVWQYDAVPSVTSEDVYLYAYSATNVDGIPASAFKTVYWPACNDALSVGIAGTYEIVSVIRYTSSDGAPAPGSSGPYYNRGPYIIKDLGSGEYQLSDALGGWYEFGRGFGYTGAAPGMTITVNDLAGDSFTFGAPVKDVSFEGYVTMTDVDVDAVAGIIVLKCDWDAGYKFVITLSAWEW